MAEENRDLKEKNDEADVFFICTEDARQFSAADVGIAWRRRIPSARFGIAGGVLKWNSG